MSEIEWTDKTWNPIVGCSKISEGCRNCYAINQAYRNASMGTSGRLAYYEGLTEKKTDRIEWTGAVRFVPEALEIPLKRKKPTIWFVNSMSDLFHESVTDYQLNQIFSVMELTPQHTYQILTKRADRMLQYCNIERANPLKNVWLGVTVENQKTADDRIPLLLKMPAAVRFLSCEPLLEEVDLKIGRPLFFGDYPKRFIDWVIVGGESGQNARECKVEWIRSIVYQCKESGVPVFVKQLGSKSNHPCLGKGAILSEFPKSLQIREFPNAATKH